MALIQALLLERRVVMLSQERDTLSAGLHAAAALLYPFRWQHIYLPYLPHSLKVSGGSFVLACYHFILALQYSVH